MPAAQGFHLPSADRFFPVERIGDPGKRKNISLRVVDGYVANVFNTNGQRIYEAEWSAGTACSPVRDMRDGSRRLD